MKELSVEQMKEINGGSLWDWFSCGLSIGGVIISAAAVDSPAATLAIYGLRLSVVSAIASCGAAIFG